MPDNIELKPMGKSAPSVPPRHPESSSLHASFKAAEEKARAAVHLQEGNLDAISIYGLAVSAWYAHLSYSRDEVRKADNQVRSTCAPSTIVSKDHPFLRSKPSFTPYHNLLSRSLRYFHPSRIILNPNPLPRTLHTSSILPPNPRSRISSPISESLPKTIVGIDGRTYDFECIVRVEY